MYRLFKRYYAPYLLCKWVRSAVVLVFICWLASSVMVLNRIKVGLDQKKAVPEVRKILVVVKKVEKYLCSFWRGIVQKLENVIKIHELITKLEKCYKNV